MSDYPRPSLTADAVVFGIDPDGIRVLLIRRGHDPFQGHWALPGGFVDKDEPALHAAARELEEETGLSGVALAELATFSEPGRDPRGWTVSVAYVGVVRVADHPARAGDDASELAWVPLGEARDLAFDHDAILAIAVERVRAATARAPAQLTAIAPGISLDELGALLGLARARLQ